MTRARFPAGYRVEPLERTHRRNEFKSGQTEVDRWLAQHALQCQRKHLSTTKVLIDDMGQIAGYYTLSTAQVDFGDLPVSVAKSLPRRLLPVAVLAWLGVAKEHQGIGLGKLLLAQALEDCFLAGQTFSFVAVILDCIDNGAKAFYRQFDFEELPGNPYRLFIAATRLEAMMRG